MELSLHGCQIKFASNKWQEVVAYLAERNYSSCALITDERLYSLYGEQLQEELVKANLMIHPILIPIGEHAKTLSVAERCWVEMQRKGLDRQSVVLALGGGGVTDLAGYVAGCYMRGIDCIYLPTTLLGMTDAAIGGKCGINLGHHKNLIGLIHHPKQVWVNPHCLQTLPIRELRSGLAEVIKSSVIWDQEFFCFLENQMEELLQLTPDLVRKVIQRTCEIKVEIVQIDERENSLRAILNWGHTFAHAIEAATHYATYLHGEAVAIGMSCAASMSHYLGFVPLDFVHRQDNLCAKAGLSTKLPEFSVDQLLSLMAEDKKAVGRNISLIVAHGIGKVSQLHDVDEAIIKKVLKEKLKRH